MHACTNAHTCTQCWIFWILVCFITLDVQMGTTPTFWPFVLASAPRKNERVHDTAHLGSSTRLTPPVWAARATHMPAAALANRVH